MSILWFPIRLLGIAAAGMALGAGWKLGSHLVDVVTGQDDLNVKGPAAAEGDDTEKLVKRTFDRTDFE